MASSQDPELQLCRRYGCRHEARDHGFLDGRPCCMRCKVERREHRFVRPGDEKRKR